MRSRARSRRERGAGARVSARSTVEEMPTRDGYRSTDRHRALSHPGDTKEARAPSWKAHALFNGSSFSPSPGAPARSAGLEGDGRIVPHIFEAPPAAVAGSASG